MVGLYPEIAPYDHGLLDVGDANLVYWEACGNPGGKPALVLHGGPGSGWYFDPDVYRIILFDQRGCGRSTPDASDPAVDLATNTTHHLLADIELLRRHLSIDSWLVFGGSWGSTLGLVYAEKSPDHVSEVVLFSVVTTGRREVEWVTRDMGRVFPELGLAFAMPYPQNSATAALSMPTLAYWPTPTRSSAKGPPSAGVPGKTPTLPSARTTSPIRGTTIRRSACALHVWSLTTGAMPRGSRMDPRSARHRN